MALITWGGMPTDLFLAQLECTAADFAWLVRQELRRGLLLLADRLQ